jgi:hypothetical protein
MIMNTNTLIAQVEYLTFGGITRVHYNPDRCPIMVNGGAFLSLGELGEFFRTIPQARVCGACSNATLEA